MTEFLEKFRPGGDAVAFAIVLLVFCAVFAVTLILARSIAARQTIRKRASLASFGAADGDASDRRSLRHHDAAGMSSRITKAAKAFAPKDAKLLSATRKKLVRAGYFSPGALHLFYGIRIFLALAFPAAFLLVTSILPIASLRPFTAAIVVTLAGLGLLTPGLFLDYGQAVMREHYRRGFPDFMDLLVICVEAGMGMQSSMARASEEIMRAHPPLGANLHLVNLELRAGRPLSESLEGLADRLGIEEVHSLAVLLKQTEELGTSLVTALRVYSDEMRDKRMMRAETRAGALPVKMVIPMGAFIFPVIMVVIMLPLVVRIRRAFL